MVEKHVNSHHQEEADDRALFGFWVYLMTDLLMFAVLFGVYAVLHNNTDGGESGNELFNLPFALTQTIILLTSSFTCGIGMIAARRHEKALVLLWFGITFALGVAFLGMSVYEFSVLIGEGQTLGTNAFMSSFYLLLGTHGLHILFGLLWIGVTMGYIVKRGLNSHMIRKLTMLSLFWHFLDIVWIFIFTIVYLGAFV